MIISIKIKNRIKYIDCLLHINWEMEQTTVESFCSTHSLELISPFPEIFAHVFLHKNLSTMCPLKRHCDFYGQIAKNCFKKKNQLRGKKRGPVSRYLQDFGDAPGHIKTVYLTIDQYLYIHIKLFYSNTFYRIHFPSDYHNNQFCQVGFLWRLRCGTRGPIKATPSRTEHSGTDFLLVTVLLWHWHYIVHTEQGKQVSLIFFLVVW